MSTFLLNHPISHAFVVNVLVGLASLTFVLSFRTFVDLVRVPAAAWPSGSSAYAWWLVAALISLLISPVSFIVAIGWTGHDGLLLSLLNLPLAAAWWLYTRERLLSRAIAAGLPWASRPSVEPRLVFGAADTAGLRFVRSVFGVLAFVGFVVSIQAVNTWTVGDPTSIDGVGPRGVTIHPRSYIAAACPTSVRQTLHLIGFREMHGDAFQRWSVRPVPGHLDEVLLDTDSGTVVCP